MRLVVLSNRLPFELKQRPDGRLAVDSGSGGLVTALRPVLRERGGIWIGSPGGDLSDTPVVREMIEAAGVDAGYELAPVPLPRDEQRGFYRTFANEAIWPLFHEMPESAAFRLSGITAARRAVRRFAEATVARLRPDDLIWVHDYHLIGAGSALRALGVRGRIAFFLHIPFPSVDLFAKMPWRDEMLDNLLDYDLIGFQTRGDRRNFLQCVHALRRDAKIAARGSLAVVNDGTRESRAGVFPIGIDFHEFADAARDERVARKAASLRADERGRKIVLGVDRLDATKGLLHRLEAIGSLLASEPQLRGTFTFVQFVVPSRQDLPRYDEIKRECERMVGEINGRFTRSGWVPIRYNFRSISRDKLLAYYRAADVALVTPLKDGMNLVAKEYVATRFDVDGVLVLSEFAGAAAQLGPGALLVNPWDIEGAASALATALRMPPDERRARMRRMRRTVRKHDVHEWAAKVVASVTTPPRGPSRRGAPVTDREPDPFLEPDPFMEGPELVEEPELVALGAESTEW